MLSPGLPEGFWAGAARWCWPVAAPTAGPPQHIGGTPRVGGGGRVVPGKCCPPAPDGPTIRVLGCAARLAAVWGGVAGDVLEGIGPGLVIHGSGGAPTTVWFPCSGSSV